MSKIWTKVLLEAIFSLRNIGVLTLGIGLVTMADQGIIIERFAGMLGATGYIGAVALYVVMVLFTLSNNDFQNNVLEKHKKTELRELNSRINKLANEYRKRLGSTYAARLQKVLQDKNDILNTFFKDETNGIKFNIVDKALNLVMSYVNLLNNFCIRSRDLEAVDVGKITERINMNTRKVSFTRDASAAADLQKIIDIDQNLLSELIDERKELGRISTKLEYMESSVGMLKRQLLSNIESDDILSNIENAVNEAEALDKVLTERRKRRMSI